MSYNWQPGNEPGTTPPTTPPQWQGVPQPGPQYAPWPPQQQPRKPRRGLPVLGCLGGGILVIAGIAVIGSAAKSHNPAAVTVPTHFQTVATIPVQTAAPVKAATPASSAAPAAATPALVATFTGSGTLKTAPFTTSATWALSYAFDCSAFGYKGNFTVFTDGGSDFNGAEVNDLAMSKSATTYAYNDAGTHYLEVNSECAWTMKIYNEG